MKKFYLILQYPYDFIEIALCSKGNIELSIQENKLTAVQNTIPKIEELLVTKNISIRDIEFIAVNTGPGPYNTLRALITTANGIHFVQKTPLINNCALDLLINENKEFSSIAILNAFAQHVFYAFNTKNNKEQGYCSIEQLIEKINRQPEQLLALGNGALLYQKQLLQNTNNKIIFHEKTPFFNSLKSLAAQAYLDYKSKHLATSYLMPKYFQNLNNF
ncbi:tRNA (adenosine(37)-N6)-threonylcarbamoyltransferase complex dimerization subunit type 1 TsaB [Candidatus Dependentiae bacterium]|nr:tRNA (adenosine(37)-N6)-threonylcarbamoyltransferase complex dimerization subunit type 1 TsaB [Candidatus Dependentiae bacterium]